MQNETSNHRTSTMIPVLIVEDDPHVTEFLSNGLKDEGYNVDSCSTGEAALQKTSMHSFPVLILDRMLPDTDGVSICTQLRQKGYNGNIIFLTAKDAVADRIEGLRAGADEYMCKPFDFDELLVRLEVVQRRQKANPDQSEREFSKGPLYINLDSHEVKLNGELIELTKREFELLHFLMLNDGKVMSRAQILSGVWGYNFEPGTKLVEVYIRYLRKKLDRDEKSLIESVRGVGYRLRA